MVTWESRDESKRFTERLLVGQKSTILVKVTIVCDDCLIVTVYFPHVTSRDCHNVSQHVN